MARPGGVSQGRRSQAPPKSLDRQSEMPLRPLDAGSVISDEGLPILVRARHRAGSGLLRGEDRGHEEELSRQVEVED